jgi:hypothetical protein
MCLFGSVATKIRQQEESIHDLCKHGEGVVCLTCEQFCTPRPMGKLNQQHSAKYPGDQSQADSDPVSSMLAAMLQSAAQLERRNSAVTLDPDYAALVEVLTNLYQIPDGLGECILRPHEAAVIRRCGFMARAQYDLALPAATGSTGLLESPATPLVRCRQSIGPPCWLETKTRPVTANPAVPSHRKDRSEDPAYLGKDPYYMSKRRLQQKCGATRPGSSTARSAA